MSKRKRSPKPLGKTIAVVGDYVLIGEANATMPSDWWLAKVLWIGPQEVLVEQYGIAWKNPHRHLHEIDRIRAIGTAGELYDIQGRCVDEMEPLIRAARAAENARDEARRAVWRRLDDFAKAEPMRNAGAGI